MTDIIQLLPDSVANQIAAGEVIQRPASVIKELVENSVDAGAKNIRVLVTDAGRTAIQVIDDGQGMSETDARLAFERHATSKIRKADDLFDLHTMGFRGEALPSIAAVAQVELLTRTADEEIGTHLTIAASKVTGHEPAACSVGCNLTVQNLFFNVPARRKFLKTNATELNNILTAFERIALVYPNVAFSLHSNGTELLNLRVGSLRQRIVDVFGKHFNQELLPVAVDTTLCRINGFVGKPEAARKKGAHNYFFVNGRFMRHPYFHKAVTAAYERLVPEGMTVPYFIYFDVSPADIDVNIHPTKTEIKFENEQAIWQILAAAVKDAIGKFCEVPTIDFDTEGRPDIPVFDPLRDNIAAPRVTYNPDYNPFRSSVPSSGSSASSPSGPSSSGSSPSAAFPSGPSSSGPFPSGSSPSGLPSSAPSPSVGYAAAPPQPSRPPRDWQLLYEGLSAPNEEAPIFPDIIAEKSPAHYQYKGKYIMTAVKSGLMIIDQHRADLRIRYEQYLSRLRANTPATQRVLFPEVLQFSPSEVVIADRLLPDLQAMGFDVSDLGGGSFAVNGIPAGTEGLDPVQLLRNIVSDAIEHGNADSEELHATLALSLARHAAIPQGQVLSNDEMENVVNGLFACSNVNYTPDGKPILCIFPQSDIERLLA